MAYLISFVILSIAVINLELFTCPRPVFFSKRKKKPKFLISLLFLCLFLIWLLVTQRPYFSVGLTLLTLLIVLVVNNTKFKTLREPLVFSDFFLYLQAVKHPRLYLPFLGVLPILGGVIVVPFIVFIGMYFESQSHPLLSWYSLGIAGFLLLGFGGVISVARSIKITSSVNDDCVRLGLFAALCCYGTQAASHRKVLAATLKNYSPYKSKINSSSGASLALADIVVVQSESFFDARLLSDNIKPSVLAEYDKCVLSSDRHGPLEVPAWGANTMRTEFAFLTGLKPKSLGLAQFYPYQQLANMEVPSIVNDLKSQGYRCVCIHPNAPGFFMRDTFFKQLNFDDFIDAAEFQNAKREGPYIADLEVSEKIKKVLNETTQPCFVFAITMENHGPLHLESVSRQEWTNYYQQEPESNMQDLTVYLRHLKNADLMIKKQLDFYQERDRETVFAFYGDHVPAISHVFIELEYDDPRSNYFIWSSVSDIEKQEGRCVMNVEALGKVVLNRSRLTT